MRRRQRLLNNVWLGGASRKREHRRAPTQNVALAWAAFAISVLLVIRTWTPLADTYTEYHRLGPRLHFYTAPKPFEGPDGANQRRALRTWLRLRPRPKVTLLGTGLEKVAREFRVAARPVDYTFLGVPLFHAVLAEANKTASTSADVVVFLNADILLFEDFLVALSKLKASVRAPWIALGARWDVDALPGDLDSVHARALLVRAVRKYGSLHTYGGIDVWAWPRGGLPPLRTRPPPFVFGRGKYDNWFTNELIEARNAAIIDISEACTVTHVRHDYHLVTVAHEAPKESNIGLPGAFWSTDPAQKFELYVNAHLAATRGRFIPQTGTILHAPLKLVICHKGVVPTLCLLRRRRPDACRCEHSTFVSRAQTDPFVVEGSRAIFCGLRSADVAAGHGPRAAAGRWPISGKPKAYEGRAPVFGLPLKLPEILDIVVNRTVERTVMLIVAARNEERLLANTVCSVKSTGMFSRLIVAVLDDKMYSYAFLQGYPVYLEQKAVYGRHERRILKEGDHTDPEFRVTRDIVGVRIMARLVALKLNVVHVRPGAVMMRNVAYYFLEEIERDVDIAFAVAVYKPSGRKLSSAGLFARGNSKSVALFNQALWFSTQTGKSIHTALDKLACGSFGGAGISGTHCQVGGGVKVKFIELYDIDFLLEGQVPQQSATTVLLLPDDRETPEGKLALLTADNYLHYNVQLGVCKNLK